MRPAVLRGFGVLEALAIVAVGVTVAASCTYTVGSLRSADGRDGGDAGDAALDTAPAPCLDTKSDTKNCGACGHDCLGRPCADGLCVPEIVAQSQDEPRTLAVDDDGIYWGSGGASGVSGCRPKACPDGPVKIADETVPVVALATSKFYLFWSIRTEIRRLAKDAPDVVRVDNGAATAVVALAADETSFYFTNTGVTGGVGRCPVAGCGPADGVDFPAYDFERPSSLALGPTGFAFFAGAQERSVVYCSPTCAAPASNLAKILAAGRTEPDTIAIDARAAYWTEGLSAAEAGVARAALADPFAPSTLTAVDSPGPLAADADFIYFVGKADGSIRKVPKTGGPAVILAKGQPAPRAIAVDAARVYFTNAGPNGNVLWVAK